ncbi:MAG: MoaA/NifB/PqqE/SkfB family radical SAM enzyme [Alteromonadaceae bacterium]|jgi:MoaA/NifB/PqqE/SkfB family radical SAM enzyme
MEASQYLPASFLKRTPATLTVITTYRCNAACKECCFESNPTVKGRLSLKQIKENIQQAYDTYPDLELVVFTGGECFLLRDDLFKSIQYASNLGLITRCVSNGFWGKDKEKSDFIVKKLLSAGISEMNFSSGVDHQQWVPFESIVNASKALVDSGIQTLVTIEKDTKDSICLENAMRNPIIDELQKNNLFSIMSNQWMPFYSDFKSRSEKNSDKSFLQKGCELTWSSKFRHLS